VILDCPMEGPVLAEEQAGERFQISLNLRPEPNTCPLFLRPLVQWREHVCRFLMAKSACSFLGLEVHGGVLAVAATRIFFDDERRETLHNEYERQEACALGMWRLHYSRSRLQRARCVALGYIELCLM